jgi:hypothetical protein
MMSFAPNATDCGHRWWPAWRLSDDGPGARRSISIGRHPKPLSIFRPRAASGPGPASPRLCCKTPKMACSVSAKRETKRKSLINMSSSALPKLPVGSSLVAVVPRRLFDRRAHSPENLSPVIQKEFCNTIPPTTDTSHCSLHAAPHLLGMATRLHQETFHGQARRQDRSHQRRH